MVSRLIKLLSKDFGGLHQAALLLGVSSLLAQVLSLFRDRLLAGTFGAGTHLDIYYTAFRIPDLIYVSFASIVSVTVLIPFIISHENTGGRAEVEKFLSSLFTVFFASTVVIGLIIFILLPWLLPLIAPGFDEASLVELLHLSRILLLSPLLLGLSNLLGSVTQSYKKFLAYTISPILYNLGIILGIVVFYPWFGLSGLVWGVVLGALGHLLIQVPSVYKVGVLPFFTVKINWPDILAVIKTSLPRTITLATNQVSLAVLVALGSLMAVGSITIFNLAFNLQSVPLVVVGVSYSVAAFPTLANLFSKGHKKEFADKVETAMRHIIFWSLPATALFIVLRAQVVRVVLGSGEFSWQDTRLTAAALTLFIISVLAQGLVQLFVRAYYASNKTKVPFVVNIFSSLVVIGSAFGLIYLFKNFLVFKYFIEILLRVEDVPGTTILMLPLAYSFGLFTNVLIYWVLFYKYFGGLSKAVYATLFQSFSAAVVSGFTAYHLLFLTLGLPLVNTQTYLGVLLQGVMAGLGGIAMGICLLWVLKSSELAEFTSALRLKIWRQPIRVDQEEI